MRPPRLIFLLFCLIFLPIFYTFISALFSSPRVTNPSALAGRSSGLHAFFSFNLPSSLFPPSAIISLTDDNSTFFLARPAAFGPSLPKVSLSGQLWVGSGFGQGGLVAGVEGELGCSDIPGWGEGESQYKHGKPTLSGEKPYGNSGSGPGSGASLPQNRRLSDSKQEYDSQETGDDDVSPPPTNDGTDDHLHHPLRESSMVDVGTERSMESSRSTTHADVQSLQESAEIAGKVVLLSRGGCGFLEKVKWAQRRGGVAVIVGDDTRGGSLVTMYARGDTSNVTIPALFTSHTTAHLLSSLIPPQYANQANRAKESKASRTRPSTHSTSSTQVADSMTTPSSYPTPSSIGPSAAAPSTVSQKPKSGLFHGILSLVGLGSSKGHSTEDSRRPPSSGNIDWVVMDSWDQLDPSDDYGGNERTKSKDWGSSNYADGDGFVIGVHDWRDPDQAPARHLLDPSTAAGKETTRTKASATTSTGLNGGRATPGSGEYFSSEKNGHSKDWSAERSGYRSDAADAKPGSGAPTKGWFSRHFGQTGASEGDSDSSLNRHDLFSRSRDSHGANSEDHEGLWVTLTPTSMSTSPFFDTLLVLVVSPLLTLSVVYALLLIRSRIRRRRWRAPKSIVDRLPVRTYHTISTPPSVSSSPRPSSRNIDSAAAPLLSPELRSESPPPRPRSGPEKPRSSPSRLWRRKYTGRQVECVVCLEEYIDGQSRVMSLPCGHEFHAECITPWLTTRRRTCPICKGDVVRSMSQSNASDESHELDDADHAEAQSASAPVVISNASEDEMSDTERRVGNETGLLREHSSAPASGWRNFASLSLSALNGDPAWHRARPDRNR
ncbi:PA and RING finger domain protein [Aspergillus glaucus CBS 516.65]|uniref:RING-type E3 ubiquitin transferase n=1 Tax=Aspergillus glaucus CBS 516.65 TaxID=1160497 RepID=A0A1L9V627_ASPGL|nr:hypothetical protein ASPGLDRAFT_52650 [Aspergillus glaucus CBS 516.65]OJJ79387.1 hypothetical protein ASPGLDRAFT_52650 [Aspergillus glaucus CBS 516.65]